ncbi:BnaC04g11840D [Brassica napus]|uniref:BnaC04g11840D protein n=1 Tax=Brassica napus TaxID=3708 RepID=A0A078FGL3_BRANA|nr:BnaC04g11840D [Brassica napus]
MASSREFIILINKMSIYA